MKISHECPLCLLEDSRRFNDYSYALIHLWDKYPEYYQFFVDELKRGREVIVDNSVFELGTAFNSYEFAKKIEKLFKDSGITDETKLTYIIPDVLDNGEETLANVMSFSSIYSSLPGKSMAVCQGKTLKELLDCYKWIHPYVSKIGISFNCKAYETWFNTNDIVIPQYKASLLNQWVHGRQFFIEMLYHSGWLNIPIHLLGIALPDEYRYYTTEHPELGVAIDTADTSNPVVHGLLGIWYNLRNGLGEKRSEKLIEFFEIEREKANIHIVDYNIKAFRHINNIKQY